MWLFSLHYTLSKNHAKWFLECLFQWFCWYNKHITGIFIIGQNVFATLGRKDPHTLGLEIQRVSSSVILSPPSHETSPKRSLWPGEEAKSRDFCSEPRASTIISITYLTSLYFILVWQMRIIVLTIEGCKYWVNIFALKHNIHFFSLFPRPWTSA